MGLLLLKWLEQCLIFQILVCKTVSTISGPSLHPLPSPHPPRLLPSSPYSLRGTCGVSEGPGQAPIAPYSGTSELWGHLQRWRIVGLGGGGGSGFLTSHMMTFMCGYSWWPLCAVTVVFNSAEAGIRVQMLFCVWIVSWPPEFVPQSVYGAK